VYLDPKSGYTYGPFPKATVEITRTYNCPSPRIVRDTSSNDSVLVDSTDVAEPATTETAPTPVPTETEVKKEDKKPEPVQNQPAAVVPLTKKEERELKRKQRQEEREKRKNGDN